MTKHTNKSGNISNNLTSFKWTPLVWILIGAIVFFVIQRMPSYLHNNNKGNFTACTEQLKNVSRALEQQISEKGSLRGIKSEDDVCHYILPGYDKPRECIGKIKEQINEICLKDSYNIKILDEQRYEIRAKSKEKSQCNICVTESAARPKTYDPTGECKKFSCVHTNE